MSFNKVGDVLVAQGNLPEALKSYRDSLAIADRLAKSDPGNAGWQRDLSVSFEKVGDVLVAQGNLPDALKSYRDSLAIADRLAKSDPGNAGWQRDLSVSFKKVGDVLVAQGNLPDALNHEVAGPRKPGDLPGEHLLEAVIVADAGHERPVARKRDGGKRLALGAVAADELRRKVRRLGRAAPVSADEKPSPAAERAHNQLARRVDGRAN